MSNNDTHIRIDGNSIEGVNDWILMSSKVLYGATKHGVYLAAGNIYRTTLSNISSAPFKSDNLIKGVKHYFDNTNNAGVVDVLGSDAYYNSYRLRFFEGGTKIRTPKGETRDGRNRTKPYGQLTGFYFFKNAVDANINRSYEVVKNEIYKKISELNNG